MADPATKPDSPPPAPATAAAAPTTTDEPASAPSGGAAAEGASQPQPAPTSAVKQEAQDGGLAGDAPPRVDQMPLDLAPRPDKGGSAGRAINLLANVYKIKFGRRNQTVTHYDVIITPVLASDAQTAQFQVQQAAAGATTAPAQARRTRPPPPGFLQAIFRECADRHAAINDRFTNEIAAAFAFDGRRNAYTTKPLLLPPGTTDTTFFVTLSPRQDLPQVPNHPRSQPANRAPRRPPPERTFKVKMTAVASINFADMIAFCEQDFAAIRDARQASVSGTTPSVLTGISVLENGLRSIALAREEYRIQGAAGRKFFSQLDTVPITAGLEIWRGFYQSVRPMMGGPAVNLDVAVTTFLGSGDLVDVMGRILGGGGFGGFGGGDRGGFRGGMRGGARGRGGGRGRGEGVGPGQPSGQGHSQPPTPRSLTATEAKMLRDKFKNATIRLNHRPSRELYKFIEFTPRSAVHMTFERDGQQVSVRDYFHQAYNITLRYPDLPCVVYKKRGARTEFVPCEFVTIVPGTPVNGFTLSGPQRQDMIAISATRPDVRRQDVQRFRRDLDYDSDAKLRAWQVSIDSNMLSLRGRVLPSPTIIYGPRSTASPHVSNGAWNLAGAKFINLGRPLITWTIVNFTRNPANRIQGFTSTLISAMQGLGMEVLNSQPHYDERPKDINIIESALHTAGREAYRQARELMRRRNPSDPNPRTPAPQLFLVFMEDQDPAFYDAIKRAATLRLNTRVASQVLNTNKALSERGTMQYAANVAMKINIKLGGCNWTVPDQALPGIGRDTMLIGADVTHPTRKGIMPSIAATVATVDGDRTRYSSEVRAQRHPGGRLAAQEIILAAKDMVEGHLKRWIRNNQYRLPSSIIFFRDGISEGQYSAAVHSEFAAIKEACKALVEPNTPLPKVTYIVITKNHHMRFFAQDSRDNDRSGNLPAGTIVDTDVTHPAVFDFFLQAHPGLQGTARPAHYIVLKDENHFSSDDLQQACHTLAYTYARATRAVSMVPPAYYADILADKCRALMWDPADDAASSVSDSTTLPALTNDEQRKLMDLLEMNPDLCESLWYM